MPAIDQTKILILATDGFEQSELFGPRDALIGARATVHLASPEKAPIQGMEHDEKGATITPDLTLDEVDPDEYDGLILPGGVANPDALRTHDKAVEIVQAFDDAGKPIAAICHGPWMLVEADIVADRTVTSWPSLRTDLENAGATYVDREVAIDGNLITSRKPADIPAFVDAFKQAVTQPETTAA
ncbi:MAG: type 1 glutamine amidotransferase domain-containing protein [Sphingobium sp.]|nr:type 1 glutamine amidotransferase domain-containing protein [Sphingobium sp.]